MTYSKSYQILAKVHQCQILLLLLRYRRECQRIYELQNRVLSSTEVVPSGISLVRIHTVRGHTNNTWHFSDPGPPMWHFTVYKSYMVLNCEMIKENPLMLMLLEVKSHTLLKISLKKCHVSNSHYRVFGCLRLEMSYLPQNMMFKQELCELT